MHNFFSFNFPLREFFFLYFARPPISQSNGPSLISRHLSLSLKAGTYYAVIARSLQLGSCYRL